MSKLRTITDNITHSVAIVDDLTGGLEALALAITTRAASWVATVPTVALAARTIETVFVLPPTTAIASSIALELVGQSVVNGWLRAKEWNANKRKTDPAANERLLLGFSGIYFAADFLLVGALEVPLAIAGEWVHLTSLLFPLMQIVSTIVTAERAAQFRREAVIGAEKAERTGKRSANRAENQAERLGKEPDNRSETDTLANLNAANRSRQHAKQATLNALLNVYQNEPHLSYAEAGRKVGRSKSWVAGALAELEAQGAIKRNGNGVEIVGK
ncbi:MAG: hypothetical protein JXA21_07035 [Anaerolineae bacterium]|nr:hypothetical protein [Anaerolineae bacterium]